MIEARDKQGSALWLGDYVELPEAYAKVIGRIIELNLTTGRARVCVERGSMNLPLSDLLKVVLVPDM